jgi:hypothetical protein
MTIMNAGIVHTSHMACGSRSDSRIAGDSEAAPIQAEALADAVAAERLADRFAEMTWKTLLPITTLGLTFAVGVLACAQFFAIQI